MISCVLIATKYGDALRSSVDSFLKQDFDGERQLVIFSTNHRIHLEFKHENVVVANVPRPCLPCDAKNTAIASIAKGEIIVMWSEDDYYLPDHLSLVARHLTKDFAWFDKEFQAEHGKIVRISQGSAETFAFTKSAWLRAGKFQRGVLNERNFIGRITKICEGDKIVLSNEEVSFVRCGTANEKRMRKPSTFAGQLVIQPAAERDYAAQAKAFVTGKSDYKVAIVELGRYGDIVNILPLLKLIHDNYAMPHLVVAREFESVFDGISYAKPYVLPLKNEDLKQAIDIAKRDFPIVLNTQIWGKGHTQIRETTAYNVESWRMGGILHRFDDPALRPVFDKRSPEREKALLDSIPSTGKPFLLVNLSHAVSSPCPTCSGLLAGIVERWQGQFDIVDLSKVRAQRFFDMIALFERAAAVVSIDTLWLHLAGATNCEVVALVNPAKWAGTVVRFNCVASMTYDQAVADPNIVHLAIEKATERQAQRLNLSISAIHTPPARRIFNLIDRYDDDPVSAARKLPAIQSQDALYESGKLVPIHCWPEQYPRNAKATLGDRRPLPYLKDLIQKFLDVADDDDICLWVNDDNLILPGLPEYLLWHIGVYGACTIFRSEFKRAPSLNMTPEQFTKATVRPHIGRDGYAFTKRWLVEFWDDIPDLILAAAEQDFVIAMIVRLTYGIKTTTANIGKPIFPAEPHHSYLGHVLHNSTWNMPNTIDSPSNRWNRKLMLEFAAKHISDLKLNSDGTLDV